MLDITIKEAYLCLFDVSISNVHNFCSTFSEREAPYTDIKEELTRIWQMDMVYIVPLVSYCPQRISTLPPSPPPKKNIYDSLKRLSLQQAIQLDSLQQNRE